MVEAKGKSIEQTGRELAENVQTRIYQGTERINAVIKHSHLERLNNPRLDTGSEDAPPRRYQHHVRYGEDGEIYTTKWQNEDVILDPETNKYTVKNSENLTNLYVKQDPIHLEELRKSAQVKRLIVPMIWEGVEAAIRMQNNVAEGYDPRNRESEPVQLRVLINWIDMKAEMFRDKKITREMLSELEKEAINVVDKGNLANAVDADRRKIADQIVKAVQEDSLGRPNSGKSRIQLRSARLKAFKRIAISDHSRRKALSNLEILGVERELTRVAMEEAVNELGGIQEKLPDAYGAQREELASDIYDIAASLLSFPKVAPYLIPARISAITLIGCREPRRDLNRRILGTETADDLFVMTPVKTYLEMGNKLAANNRIESVKGVLEQALEENKDKHISREGSK